MPGLVLVGSGCSAVSIGVQVARGRADVEVLVLAGIASARVSREYVGEGESAQLQIRKIQELSRAIVNILGILVLLHLNTVSHIPRIVDRFSLRSIRKGDSRAASMFPGHGWMVTGIPISAQS